MPNITPLFTNAEILASKICHDLAGSIGAVHNGIEMLRDYDPNDPEMLEFIERNTEELIAKLRFYRFIYGHISADHKIKTAEVGVLINDYFKNSKIKIKNFTNEFFPEELNLMEARLICILCFIIEKTLISDGNIKFHMDNLANNLEIIGEGSRIRIPECINLFNNNEDLVEVTTDNIPFLFASEIAKLVGAKVGYSQDNNCIKLSCSLNNE